MRSFYCGIDHSMLLLQDAKFDFAINTMTGSHACKLRGKGPGQEANAVAMASRTAGGIREWVRRGCYWLEPIDFVVNAERTRRMLRQWREEPHQVRLSSNRDDADFVQPGAEWSHHHILVVERGRDLADLEKCLARLPALKRNERDGPGRVVEVIWQDCSLPENLPALVDKYGVRFWFCARDACLAKLSESFSPLAAEGCVINLCLEVTAAVLQGLQTGISRLLESMGSGELILCPAFPCLPDGSPRTIASLPTPEAFADLMVSIYCSGAPLALFPQIRNLQRSLLAQSVFEMCDFNGGSHVRCRMNQLCSACFSAIPHGQPMRYSEASLVCSACECRHLCGGNCPLYEILADSCGESGGDREHYVSYGREVNCLYRKRLIDRMLEDLVCILANEAESAKEPEA